MTKASVQGGYTAGTDALLAACEAVFFDIDGTLVDSNEFHVVAWDKAFRKNGRSVARHLLRMQIGKGSDVLIPSLFPGIRDEEQGTLSDAHSAIFKNRFLQLVRPFPHAGAFVRMLHEGGKKVLLVSSSDEKEVKHYTRLLDIEECLSATVSSDDVQRTKPAGDLFAVALKKSGVDAEHPLAIGDTPYDVEAAAKCGVAAIALRSGGFTDERLDAAGAAAVEPDIDALFSQRLTDPR